MPIISKEFMDAYHQGVLDALGRKQNILESGRNIKTVNGQSIVGEGDLEVKTGDLDENGRYILTDENGRRFFVNTTELIKPNAPSIATTSYTCINGHSIGVAVTNNTNGATMYYRFKGSDQWIGVTNYISFVPDFDGAPTVTFTLQLKAVKNGEESDVSEVNISVQQKVDAGSVSVNRTPNNNNWATQATITLKPSSTSGATSEFSEDGGNTWTALTSQTTLTVNSSQAANKYQVRATKSGYAAADTAKSIAFTLNAKKAYYGFSTKSALSSSADITSLIGGGNKEATALSGALTITPTGNQPGYIWLCCTGTLQKDKIVPNQGDVIPFGFEAAITIDGWNCYRCTNAINPESTNVYIP